MSALDENSLALVALTNRLDPSDVPPLKAPEVWTLLEKVPEPSRLLGLDSRAIAEMAGTTSGEAERISRLLDTGVALAVRLESLLETGIFPVTAMASHYPHRLRERLNGAAPPILYCAGELSLLESDGVGVVGSRHIGPESEEVTRSIAQVIASAGLPLVSGGAQGVDKIGMAAASEAGGGAVGVLADSLEKAIGRSENRRALLEGIACFCTPYSPNAPFTAGNAMGRNKVIYGLSRATVVITSAHGEGGTWAGATEALRKGYGRVAVWMGPGSGPGNASLVHAGAIPIDRPDAVLDLPGPSGDMLAPDQMELAFDGAPSGEKSDVEASSRQPSRAEDGPGFLCPPVGALVPKPTGTCWCGCGNEVGEEKFFLPRHQARAAQRAVIKHFGSVEAFLLAFEELPGRSEVAGGPD